MALTSEQLRAARALLRIEQSGLAERSGVSLATIKRLETAPGELTGAQASTVSSLRLALEEAGVIFLDDKEGTPRGGPGVRLAEKQTEPSEEHMEWIRQHLQDAMKTRVHGTPLEDVRENMSGAIVDGLQAARDGFAMRFSDPDGELFQKAAGSVIAAMVTGLTQSSVRPLPKPRKHYDRSDPESGAGMKGSRPVARRALISPTSDDDE